MTPSIPWNWRLSYRSHGLTLRISNSSHLCKLAAQILSMFSLHFTLLLPEERLDCVGDGHVVEEPLVTVSTNIGELYSLSLGFLGLVSFVFVLVGCCLR